MAEKSEMQCSQRGSPSALGLDGGGRRLAVPSGLFQKLPRALRPKTVAPAVPRSPPRNKMTRAPPCSFVPRLRNEMTGAPYKFRSSLRNEMIKPFSKFHSSSRNEIIRA